MNKDDYKRVLDKVKEKDSVNKQIKAPKNSLERRIAIKNLFGDYSKTISEAIDKKLIPDGFSPIWYYSPEDLPGVLVLELDKNGEKKNSWGISKNGKMIFSGTFQDITKKAIEMASKK